MRVIAALIIVAFALAAAPARAANECDALQGSVVTATGVVSDLTYRDAKDLTSFFIRDSNLPCRGDVWVFVSGRTRCANGNTIMVEGRFDQVDTGSNVSPYAIETNAEHVRCK